MKEKLSDFALIAEIISAVCIVASLLFVGVQIQQNTDIQKASSYQNVIDEIALWRSQIVSNPELSELFGLFANGTLFENSTENDIRRISMQVTNFFGAVESAYYSKKYGLMGDSEWERLESAVCIQLHDYKENFGENNSPNYISTEFSTFLEETC